MRNTKFLTSLPIAAAFIGTVVGAGFATGQEVLQFFTFFGWKSFLGIGIATILFCYFGIAIMGITRNIKADSHFELVRYVLGPRLGILIDWFITFSFFGVLVVMAAGAGAVAEEQLDLAPIWGSLLVIFISFLTVVSGVKNVIRAIAFVVPFLLLTVFGIAIFSIFSHPVTPENINFISSLEPPLPTDWAFSSLLYVSYNILLSVAILSPLGIGAINEKTIVYGGLLGGLGLGFAILAINLAILSRIPEILPFQVPMVFLAKQLSPLSAYACGLVLLLEIYTTAVSVLYGFTARIDYKNNLHRLTWAGLASAAAILAAQFGFSKVVSAIYPVMGIVGFIFLVSILWASFPRKANHKKN